MGLNIIIAVVAIDIIADAVLPSYEVSSAAINAFIVGMGVGSTLIYYIIRFTVVKKLKKEMNNDSLEYILFGGQ